MNVNTTGFFICVKATYRMSRRLSKLEDQFTVRQIKATSYGIKLSSWISCLSTPSFHCTANVAVLYRIVQLHGPVSAFKGVRPKSHMSRFHLLVKACGAQSEFSDLARNADKESTRSTVQCMDR